MFSCDFHWGDLGATCPEMRPKGNPQGHKGKLIFFWYLFGIFFCRAGRGGFPSPPPPLHPSTSNWWLKHCCAGWEAATAQTAIKRHTWRQRDHLESVN